jgi:hypothetical protein
MIKPNHPQWIRAACLSFCAMAAAAQSPAPATNPPQAIAADTRAPNDTRQDENVFYIRSSGLIADSTFIAASLNSGGSGVSEKLALLILEAQDHPYRITVAGGNELKTMRVIKDAFDSAGLTQLTFLDFTFIGSPKAAARVEKLVAAVHGTFHTRPTLYP